ncbi:MAG: metal ABC transporter permease [Alphaproteobacteria bacterium]
MTWVYDFFIAPFADYAFMRRALAAVIFVACGSAPLGVLLMLRRMSLIAEAMSHAILPGVAVAFMIAGFSLSAMSLGGFVAGVFVALLAGLIARITPLRDDASFAALYPTALALGVLLISLQGTALDLMHLLFGTVLAIDRDGLFMIAGIAIGTLGVLAAIYRPLVIAICDPAFLRSQGAYPTFYHLVFLVLVTFNLVAGFEAMGTLMAVGMMMIPAISARFWARRLDAMLAIAVLFALLAGIVGLTVSYHLGVASGPTIILAAAVIYFLSLALGRYDSLRARFWPGRHLAR